MCTPLRQQSGATHVSSVVGRWDGHQLLRCGLSDHLTAPVNAFLLCATGLVTRRCLSTSAPKTYFFGQHCTDAPIHSAVGGRHGVSHFSGLKSSPYLYVSDSPHRRSHSSSLSTRWYKQLLFLNTWLHWRISVRQISHTHFDNSADDLWGSTTVKSF